MQATSAIEPASFDPFDLAIQRDPYPSYARLRDEAPVLHLASLDAYVLSRFEDILRALRDPATFSSAKGLTPIPDEQKLLGLAPTFIMMDPPDHTRLRKLISKAFTRERVAVLDEAVRRFVASRVEGLFRKARAEGSVDVVRELTSPLPTFVLAEILGVPEADRERFDPWSNAITSGSLEPAKVEAAVLAVAHLFTYFIELIERRRREPGEDLLSDLVRSQREGEPLTNWDILGFCFVFVAGGNDTTNHLLANALVALEAHPEQRRLLASDATLVPSAIEEFLRFDAPVQGLSRCTTREVELHGVRIPAGKKVHMLFGSGNRDPREYGVSAAELDVRREVTRHLSFSQGPHFCIGAHFARSAASTALAALLARAPAYVLPEAGRERFLSPFVRGYAHLPFVPDGTC